MNYVSVSRQSHPGFEVKGTMVVGFSVVDSALYSACTQGPGSVCRLTFFFESDSP